MTTFPSTSQKSIWHTYLFMSPFYEIIPTDKDDKCENLVKGEKDFYEFMAGLYSDMYKNPDNYFIPTDEYDNYMKGRTKKDLPHKNDSKECTLRNKFQKSIKFYQDFLYNIGKYGEIDLGSLNLIITESKFEKIIKKFKNNKKEDNNYKCIDALKLMNFDYNKLDKKITFFNNTFPMMFLGLTALSKSKNINYGYTCYLLCDYRGILKDFEINFDDTLLILDDKHKHTINKMNEIMKQINTRLKIKPLRSTQLGFFWKLQYSKDGKAVATFHIDINETNYFINFNSVENISKIGFFLKGRSLELYNWFFDHIKTMKCSCKNNRNVDIGGVKKRICGLMSRMEIYSPNEFDLDKMRNILEIFHFEMQR